MSLRKSPVRSATLLAACRANAQKSTGPRTPEGKARSCLNSLRHGRRARSLYRLLPRGLSFDDRLLYNWIFRALRNSFPPRTPAHEAKVRRAALEIWREMSLQLRGEKCHRTRNVTENRPVRNETRQPPFYFRLQAADAAEPQGRLDFLVSPRGRNPRWTVGALEPRRRAQALFAVWRGNGRVEDWGPEPLPDPENDPAGLYHWRRDMRRQFRALRRAQAREARREARSKARSVAEDRRADELARRERDPGRLLPGIEPPAVPAAAEASLRRQAI